MQDRRNALERSSHNIITGTMKQMGRAWRGVPLLVSFAGPEEDLAESRRSVEKLTVFDDWENVFTILAHDGSLLDVLELFPKTANDWKTKAWKEKSHWRFLPQLCPEGKRNGR
jgi:hypothetical protein